MMQEGSKKGGLWRLQGGVVNGYPWGLEPDGWAPNAAVSGDLNGLQHTVVVTLGRPTYDEKKRILVYERVSASLPATSSCLVPLCLFVCCAVRRMWRIY